MQRQNLIYSLILGSLCVALIIVGILLLRRRSQPASRSITPAGQDNQLSKPTPSRPIDSYVPEPPFQPGDPSIPVDDQFAGGQDGSENVQP